MIALINGAFGIPTILSDQNRKGQKGKGKNGRAKREGKGEEEEVKEGKEMKAAASRVGVAASRQVPLSLSSLFFFLEFQS